MNTAPDFPAVDDEAGTPKGTVETIGGITRIQLPFEVFNRCQLQNDRRTGVFFTDIGAVHEGQSVIVWSYGDHSEPSARGTVQRAREHPQGKWFVQLPMRPPRP